MAPIKGHKETPHSLFHGARSTVNSFIAIRSGRKPGDQFSAWKEGRIPAAMRVGLVSPKP
jgi:hypothetical protein